MKIIISKEKIVKSVNHIRGYIWGIKKISLDYLILTKLYYLLTNFLVKNIC